MAHSFSDFGFELFPPGEDLTRVDFFDAAVANVDIDSNNQIRLVNVEYYLEFEKELKELLLKLSLFNSIKSSPLLFKFDINDILYIN